MKLPLTISNVKKLQPKDKYYEVWDTRIPGFLCRVQPTGVVTYYLFYRNEFGEKRTCKIGRGITAVQARSTAEKLLGKIANGVDVAQEIKDKRIEKERAQQRTLEGFLDSRYTEYLSQNRRTGDSADQCIRTQFSGFLKKDLGKITKWDIDKWRLEKKKDGLKDHTLERYLAELRSLLNRAVEWDLIDSNPFWGVRRPKAEDNRRVRYLSDPERKRLYQALTDRDSEKTANRSSANEWRESRGYETLPTLDKDRFFDHLTPIVLLALNTGLRRGEILALRWENVDFDSKQVTVESSSAKSKKKRHIPLNEEALAVFAHWKKQQESLCDYVFPGANGAPMKDIKKGWRELMKKAEISDFKFHDLRHDFASQLVMSGVSLYVVKELLGHSTIQMTERYAHLGNDELKDAVALLGGI